MIASVDEKIVGEITRETGNRLLVWTCVSLWVVAVLTLFRLFRSFPPAVDNWLLWITPLMIARAIVGVATRRELVKGTYAVSSRKRMKRLAIVLGISDGFLLLSALLIFGGSGMVPVAALIPASVLMMGVLSIVYIFAPVVIACAGGVALIPAAVLAIMANVQLPVELMVGGAAILGASIFGVLRFGRLYVNQLRGRIDAEQQLDEINHSNYVFNQHWQRTSVACIDWDCDFKIRSWNPAAEALFGYSAEEAMGSSLELLFPPEEKDRIRAHWLEDTQCQPGKSIRICLTKQGEPVKTTWYDTVLSLHDEFIGVASFAVAATEVCNTHQSFRGQPIPALV